MKNILTNTAKLILCILCAAIVSLQGAVDVFAISTKFDVPSIEQDWTPDNCLYKSPNLNIMVCNWSYGLVADVLNTSNLDTLLSELHTNISPAGYKRPILGIYMNGAGFSSENASAIKNAGWSEVNMYYDTYFVAGSAPTAAMTPSVAMTQNESAKAVLAEAGVTENVAMIAVSDVNMTWANIIIYGPEFKFLKGKNLYSFKFIEDLGVFVAVGDTYFGSYGANFLEIFDLQNAETTIDGTYVTVTQSLPEELVVSAEQIPTLRESISVTQPMDTVDSTPENIEDTPDTVQPETDEIVAQEEESETTDESNPTEAENADTVEKEEQSSAVEDQGTSDTVEEETPILNTEQTVEWKFAHGHMPDDFTPEAAVKALNETEVSVEFAFSGELPEDTEVTIEIPSENVAYTEGASLYFYYCNPDNDSREFVSEGQYKDEKVTFRINHCSEYVITTLSPEEVAQTETGILIWPFIVVAIIVLAGIAGLFIAFSRKKL